MINVTVRSRHVGKQLTELSTKTRQACHLAINDTVKQLRFEAGKIIRSNVAISKPKGSNSTPKKLIESRIQLVFAPKRLLQGRVIVKASKVSIRWFKPAQPKKGIATAQIRKGGSRVEYRKGFGPRNEKLGRAIFERTGKDRFPIKQVEGVDIAEILRQVGGDRQLQMSARERLNKNVKRRIERIAYVGRRKGKPSPGIVSTDAGAPTS